DYRQGRWSSRNLCGELNEARFLSVLASSVLIEGGGRASGAERLAVTPDLTLSRSVTQRHVLLTETT
ncbi:MAG: hypothetical protein NHB36_09135, partial [Nitrospira sp.]|nr:hypothetical protein [Nitrospira sp.]